ncbi:MAG: radical SAM protein, partial [Pseudomonadota bacterium]
MKDVFVPEANIGKFKDPVKTADGQARARVALTNPETLWFNTGTRCNITCLNCYIESSPKNDRLQYVNREEVRDYLDQIDERKWPIREIAYTGGEPFMNPHMIGLARDPLARGFDVLILTNAMKPM